MEVTRSRTGPTPAVGKLAVCPYNDAHAYPEERYQFHLTKCGRQVNKRDASGVCTFNQTHTFPASGRRVHEASCPDRHFVYRQFIGNGAVSNSNANAGQPDEGATEWVGDDDWPMAETPVLAVVKSRNDAAVRKPMAHIGQSKAQREATRQREAQLALIRKWGKGESVPYETMKIYAHSVPEQPLHEFFPKLAAEQESANLGVLEPESANSGSSETNEGVMKLQELKIEAEPPVAAVGLPRVADQVRSVGSRLANEVKRMDEAVRISPPPAVPEAGGRNGGPNGAPRVGVGRARQMTASGRLVGRGRASLFHIIGEM